MTEADRVFRRDTRAGWLILSSEVPSLGSEYPQLAEHIVQRMNLSRPAASLLLGDDPPLGWSDLLEGVEALFGHPVANLNFDQPIPDELSNAGLLVLGGGDRWSWLAELNGTRLEELVLRALHEGALIVATGEVAAVVGSWTLPPGQDSETKGLNWLPGAVVLPDEADPASLVPIQELLTRHDRAYALGLNSETVVALGPGGEIEVWGESQPTLLLGSGWEHE